MTDQSKEEYREAAHRLYMEQERQKRKLQKFKSSSPPPSSTSFTTPHSTQRYTVKHGEEEEVGGEGARAVVN